MLAQNGCQTYDILLNTKQFLLFNKYIDRYLNTLIYFVYRYKVHKINSNKKMHKCTDFDALYRYYMIWYFSCFCEIRYYPHT